MDRIKIAYRVDDELFVGTLDDYASAWQNVRYAGDFELDTKVIAVVEGEFKELEVSSEFLYSSNTDYMYYALRIRDPKTKHMYDFVETRLDGRV